MDVWVSEGVDERDGILRIGYNVKSSTSRRLKKRNDGGMEFD